MMVGIVNVVPCKGMVFERNGQVVAWQNGLAWIQVRNERAVFRVEIILGLTITGKWVKALHTSVGDDFPFKADFLEVAELVAQQLESYITANPSLL